MAVSHRLTIIKKQPLQFLIMVVKGFIVNKGMLLSGAVAYYTLLSIIPLFIILFLVLSNFIEAKQLITFLGNNLESLLPGQAQQIATHVAKFVSSTSIGWVMFFILLFFSTMAFNVIENALDIIFKHRTKKNKRHYAISAVLPYVYIVSLGLGFLVITIISGVLQLWQNESLSLFGHVWQVGGVASFLFYWLSIVSMVLILTSVYIVMPVGHTKFNHAFLGSLFTIIIWEFARNLLVWYFSTLSMVNMIYGSLATSIILLLFLEVGSIIFLFGAQLISEYEKLDT